MTDNDMRWRIVEANFRRADGLRIQAASHALRGPAYAERRKRLRAAASASEEAAIRLREEITGGSES